MNRVIECHGTAFENGQKHGSVAKSRIEASIVNYTKLFRESVNLSWPEATKIGSTFLPALEKHVPHLLEEMRGIAEGSGRSLLDIVVLNARSEIALTKSSKADPPDGCTAFSKLDQGTQWLQQNWDWSAAQLDQIIVLRTITREGLKLTTMCEAGQVGKVGMNSAGVAVTLNALKTVQMDASMLPIHVALRLVLESTSVEQAVTRLESTGVASAAHFLIADPRGSIGLEVNPVRPFGKIKVDTQGNIFHTNHCVASNLPSALTEVPWLKDSPLRLSRIETLVASLSSVTFGSLFEVFKDEQGLPNAINRNIEPDATNQICTVFTVIMNCNTRALRVTFGRPTEYRDSLSLDCSA